MKDSPSLVTSSYYVQATGNQKVSRYKYLKRLVNEDGDNYIETPNKRAIKETTSDTFYQVESGYENRLDLISNNFYSTPLLWWAIAMVNHLDNPMEVPVGIVLRIPNINNIPV